ncbi:uncharacterized protein BDV14DRAFT_46333 [Aspergillus stella-maris]|uniref:uncharacterized protein n=1 Tax=Aspergillus stella-maris TaxID=1810926 RepID=UPI003CCE4342
MPLFLSIALYSLDGSGSEVCLLINSATICLLSPTVQLELKGTLILRCTMLPHLRDLVEAALPRGACRPRTYHSRLADHKSVIDR